MNLSIAKHFASNRTTAVATARKLAAEGQYVVTVNGDIVWQHGATVTGYDGPEWMKDMLRACDPFTMTGPERTMVGYKTRGLSTPSWDDVSCY